MHRDNATGLGHKCTGATQRDRPVHNGTGSEQHNGTGQYTVGPERNSNGPRMAKRRHRPQRWRRWRRRKLWGRVGSEQGLGEGRG